MFYRRASQGLSKKLATKAHDMGMTIANRYNTSSSSYEFNKDNGETEKSSNPSKASEKYAFPYLDLLGMLENLLENEIIELPAPKQLKKVRTTIDPKYYRYH